MKKWEFGSRGFWGESEGFWVQSSFGVKPGDFGSGRNFGVKTEDFGHGRILG